MTAAGAFRTGASAVSQAACAPGRASAAGAAADRPQRAVEASVVPGGEAGDEAALADVDRRDADAVGQRAGAQQQRQRLEVAAGAGGELQEW